METKFDICCVSRFSFSEPRFSRICAVDPVVRLIATDRVIDEDGYLGVSLSQLESLWLVKVLRRLGVDSYPVPEMYKSSNVSADKARFVAQEFVMRKRIQNPEYEYADAEEVAVAWWLSKIAYGYFSKSEKMLREGITPAGVTMCIDRVSGRILEERELINAELPIMLTE